MSGSLRMGVVGVGFGATVHIPAFQSEGIDVVAICSRRRERVEEAAARFGVDGVFTDLGEMLAMPGLDAVSIVSPVPQHHPMTMAALAAGKHVICEKPFSTDQSLARELWQTAKGSGLTAMIAHEFRFASGRMRVKELLDEAYVGKPRIANMRLVLGNARPPAPPVAYDPGRDDAALGAGFLWGLGSHYIDCIRHWFGEVESVSGDVTNFTGDRVAGDRIVQATADDTFIFTLHCAGGVIVNMVATRSAPFGSGASIEIYGSEGALVTPQTGLNPPAQGVILGARPGDERLQELTIPDRLQPFADERDDRLMPFRLFTREFLRGVREGTSPAPGFYDGYRCQQILDAVRESSATGRRVAIPAA